MSRSKGTANLAASLEVLAGAPLDAREKVPTKADLYIAANFPYPYVGLETYVVSENKKYRLIGNDVTVEANWQEVGSGGGGGTTVVANPEGEATDELEKLQVGNDIYSIPSGGGGSADTEIIADDFDPTESYAVGDYVVYEGVLYKCTTAHTGAWDASDFDDTQIMAEMPTPMPSADMSEVVNPLPGVMSRTKIYSPEEQVVAEWREYVDGVLKKKPVYEKVVVGTTPSSTGTWQQSTTIDSNMDMCVGIISFAKLTEGYYFSNYSEADFLTKVNNGVLYFNVTSPFASKPVHTVLQYTKTTDEWEVI